MTASSARNSKPGGKIEAAIRIPDHRTPAEPRYCRGGRACAKGAIVTRCVAGKREVTLADALTAGHLAGAALDVQEPEPLPKDHVLWSMQNVILTAHIGWKAIESRKRLVDGLAQNIKAYLDGSPVNVVPSS